MDIMNGSLYNVTTAKVQEVLANSSGRTPSRLWAATASKRGRCSAWRAAKLQVTLAKSCPLAKVILPMKALAMVAMNGSYLTASLAKVHTVRARPTGFMENATAMLRCAKASRKASSTT